MLPHKAGKKGDFSGEGKKVKKKKIMWNAFLQNESWYKCILNTGLKIVTNTL